MADEDRDWVVLGHVGAPYGVKGWVKIHADTEAPEAILEYSPWYLRREGDRQGEWREAELEEGRTHGKGVVAKFAGCDDRDAAARLRGHLIAVRREQLPPAGEGEYYWADLVGLRVVNTAGEELGVIDHLMATGANDVLVVKGDRERLIPFVMGHVVKSVDLDGGVMRVDWDADYLA